MVNTKMTLESERKKKMIVDLLEEHPEGLSTQEIHNYFGGEMTVENVRSHLAYLRKKEMIGIIGDGFSRNTYIPISEVPFETEAEKFIRINKLASKDMRSNIVYKVKACDVLTTIESYPNGVSYMDLAKRMKISVPSSEYERMKAIVAKYVECSFLVKEIRTVNGRVETTYKVRRRCKDMEEKLKNRKTPISYIYSEYYRNTITLKKGKMPAKVINDLIRCIEHTEVVKNITPKEIDMRIRFVTEKDELKYIINISKTGYRIINPDLVATECSAEELIAFLKSKKK